MAERISPDAPEFANRWFRLRRGFIPWISFKGNPYRRAFYRRYKWINQYSRNANVLDVPCGMGWGTSLIKNTKSLTGVDLDSEAVCEAKSKYGKHANFVVGSMEKLEFADKSFDVVACLEGIEHVPQAVALSFLSECKRVLVEDGYLLISSPHTPSGEHSGNEFHIHEYATEELRDILNDFFLIKNVESRTVGGLIVDFFTCRNSKGGL